MGRYVLRRVVLLLPTLILVVVVAFFLSKWMPGDAAHSLLSLQGVNPDSYQAKIEYERNYKKLNLDKPVFYFSLLPNFYPENLHSIVSASDRQQVKDLLHQKIPYHLIQTYIHDKNNSIGLIQQWNSNVKSPHSEQIKNQLAKVDFETSIDKISVQWLSIKRLLPDSLYRQCNVFQSCGKLASSRVKFYYPVLRWNGLVNQFHIWASSLLRYDLGVSIRDGGKVTDKILSALKWTLFLALINVLFSSLIAIPSGLLAGYRAGSILDKSLGLVWLVFYSIPVFWLASLLIVYCTSEKYSAWLNIFPIPGLWYIPEGQGMWTTIGQYSHQLVLPVACLVANDIAQLSRIVRNNVIEQKSKMYVLMAKAKGLNDFDILRKHILPNILIPMITILGGKIHSSLSGALLVEVIFNIPGMGRLMYNSLFQADWNVVFGILIIVSLIAMLVMLVTDILYAYVNPKIKATLS